MTDQHPLTDEICDGLVPFYLESEYDYAEMRAAADWQLKQVIEWLRDNLCIEEDGLPRYLNNTTHEECAVIYKWKVIADLKHATRPTTTQEDNNE